MKDICFDIETGPLPVERLKVFEPEFAAPGNYKDPEKIAACIEQKRAEWTGQAALSPLTGRILCIGMLEGDRFEVIESPDEAVIIRRFLMILNDDPVRCWIGFNSAAFDLPFVFRRAWAHDISLPNLWTGSTRRWYQHVDLMEVWQMGDRQARVSLKHLAAHLGIGEKTIDGSQFAALWTTDRAKALDYLKNDLRLTRSAAIRMGVISLKQ